MNTYTMVQTEGRQRGDVPRTLVGFRRLHIIAMQNSETDSKRKIHLTVPLSLSHTNGEMGSTYLRSDRR